MCVAGVTKQPDVQDMIWEVDEDCDQCVSWQEFQSMYRRCRNDTTGYEPRRLFNVVEFVMNDKDDSGTVSVEEAMSVLYLRYGKGVLDEVRRLRVCRLPFASPQPLIISSSVCAALPLSSWDRARGSVSKAPSFGLPVCVCV